MLWPSLLLAIGLLLTCCVYESRSFEDGTPVDASDKSFNHVLLYSLFSWGKIRGNVTFSWAGPGSKVRVDIGLDIVGVEIDPEPEEYDWAIHEMPVRYDMMDRCSQQVIGAKVHDLSSLFGKLVLPMQNGSHTFESDNLAIIGNSSIWGHSMKISGSRVTCSNVHGVGGEKTYESRFHTPVGGSVWIRSWSWNVGFTGDPSGQEASGTQLLFMTDLFNTMDDEPTSSSHDWNLYVSDILDEEEHRSSCNFLVQVYDKAGRRDCDDTSCPDGRLTVLFGQLRIASSRSRFSRKVYRISGKELPDLSGPRKLYVGIEDPIVKDNVFACAQLRNIRPKKTSAVFNADGVKGSITIEQTSTFNPTELSLDLHGLRAFAGGFRVHELPAGSPRHPGHNPCQNTGEHYNPDGTDPQASPIAGLGTHDQYELGDLSGKHGLLVGLTHISATVIDQNLPLFGPRSVIGRAIVIHRNEDGSRWVCSNLRPGTPVVRAVALFRYPLVGEVVMEQEADDPLADTLIMVGPLLYSDGTFNDTSEHEWHIHTDKPGKDFYNWTQRCVSAGPHYNPYKISTGDKVYKSCGPDSQERCTVADLVRRHGPLRVAGSTQTAHKTRKIFTDSNLPLTGPSSILQHSLVIHDKDAPKHRGDRMACTGIFRRFRYKGVAHQWSSAEKNLQVEGKIEFIQETEFDPTLATVDLRGLRGLAQDYHIHMVPVQHELAFPCTENSVYGRFNPLNVTKSAPSDSPTYDQYEVGDLSGKYGDLRNVTWTRDESNDTNLALFGSNSILGRSVVIHKTDGDRWLCGSVGWGYSTSEARHVSAIASFHHPKGFAWGYVRLRQLIYEDGAMSETFIEVSLRHPGNNNKNVTRSHNWSVYVNPVGVDASIKFFNSRCVAAGYRWNPFLIQLARPNDVDYYDKECTPEFPLRCEAGDLSGRLGPIDVGDKRYIFMDKNLPLGGEHTAMGKAIIIHNERGRVERFACANIEPDDDIVKWANIRKVPRFSPAVFMDEVREILGAAEWFVAMDLQSVTFSADNLCVSFKLHFMGPLARELELDFSRLMASGKLDGPTVRIPGQHPDLKRKKKLPYKACGGVDDLELDDKKQKTRIQWWDFSAGTSMFTSNHFFTLTFILWLSFIIK